MTIDRRHFLAMAASGLSCCVVREEGAYGEHAEAARQPSARTAGQLRPRDPLRLDPKDDGAILDGVADDTLPLAKLVARTRAIGSRPVIIDFGGGTMRCGPVPNSNTAFAVAAGSNVTLRNGKLLIKGRSIADYPAAAIWGTGFASLALDTIEIDYENPPYFQARCVALSGADAQFDWAGYWSPSFDDAQTIYERHEVSHDPIAVVTFAPSHTTAFKIDARSGTRLWLRELTDIVTSLVVGKLYTIAHRNFEANAISLEGGSNLTMSGCRIRAAAGAGVFARYIDEIRVSRHDQSPASDSARWQTTNVDSLHFDMCSGRIDVRDSNFGYCGDDALNIVSREYQAIAGAQRTLTLVTPGSTPPTIESALIRTEVGDQIAFSDETGVPRGIAKILAQTGAGTRMRRVTLDFVPIGLNGAWRVNLLRYAPAVRIVNNRIGRNRGRGIVGIARNVEIKNNRISGTFSTAIEVGVSPYQKGFSEGELHASNIVVAGNVIERCAVDRAYTSAAIIVAAYKPDGTHAPSNAGHDVQLVRNTISDCANSAILVTGFTGVSITENSVAKVASNPFATPAGTTASAIAIMNCDDVHVAGNTVGSGVATIGLFGMMGPRIVWKVNPGMRRHGS